MNIKSTYCKKIEISPNIKTAIIYSLDDLFAYVVAIKEGKKEYYISEKNSVLKFGNMAEAKQAALKEKVSAAYLALSKTYEEPDLSTCHANHQDSYDYVLITLQEK